MQHPQASRSAAMNMNGDGDFFECSTNNVEAPSAATHTETSYQQTEQSGGESDRIETAQTTDASMTRKTSTRSSSARFLPRPTRLPLVAAVVALAGTAASLSCVSGHKREIVFPSNDDYDVMAFHPDTAVAFGSGAPYGGYSRACRSRLAKLPIRLVGDGQFDQVNEGRYVEYSNDNIDDEDEHNSGANNGDNNSDDNKEAGQETSTDGKELGEHYFTMRDGEGRLFACAVYHEDDLHAQSLTDSVFNDAILAGDEPPAPIAKKFSSGMGMGKNTDAVAGDMDVKEFIRTGGVAAAPRADRLDDIMANIGGMLQGNDGSPAVEAVDVSINTIEVERISRGLQGVCAQVHHG
jgi:hypothetical protein